MSDGRPRWSTWVSSSKHKADWQKLRSFSSALYEVGFACKKRVAQKKSQIFSNLDKLTITKTLYISLSYLYTVPTEPPGAHPRVLLHRS